MKNMILRVVHILIHMVLSWERRYPTTWARNATMRTRSFRISSKTSAQHPDHMQLLIAIRINRICPEAREFHPTMCTRATIMRSRSPKVSANTNTKRPTSPMGVLITVDGIRERESAGITQFGDNASKALHWLMTHFRTRRSRGVSSGLFSFFGRQCCSFRRRLTWRRSIEVEWLLKA